MAWVGYEKPTNWRTSVVPRILREQPCCQLRYPGCTYASTMVDHRIPIAEGGTHHDSNLQGSCDSCHAIKSKAEAARGRARAPRPRRSPETHPGLA